MLICGSRTWTDRALMAAVIARIPPGSPVVHGGARGADRMADALARARGLAVEVYPADWARYGMAAGPLRDLAMLARGVDVVLAFRAPGPSPGTDHMIRIARAAGVRVWMADAG
ncbi:conserved protein of unknown function [Candidatus Hydrogenisulfobacillus filiaventi]|uniref:YspA cpYpsA-related SLOG domain-containing protein n=1 Tax=Candidatus Hydrogenisulfobacillus filiaventi TaxID=2707344 RepID=A0A6F8ZHU9_9FIRM|nr:conserved protein of unknown function [Candidatus Hydrogenisulfobacillus filiaventi]